MRSSRAGSGMGGLRRGIVPGRRRVSHGPRRAQPASARLRSSLMPAVWLDELLSRFTTAAPATEDSIRAAEATLGWRFLDDFRSFLRVADGGSAMLAEAYVDLWPVSEILSSRETLAHAFQREYRGFVPIGCDG